MIVNLRRLFYHRNIFYSILGLLAISTLYVQVDQFVASGPVAISGVKTEQKIVALTFDHSWGNTFTPPILDTLRENEVKVTFFVMGPWAKKYPEVAARIVNEGHEIGNHGYRHENYGNMTADWVKEDILKSHEMIKEVTHTEPTLLRPPNGHYSKTSLETASLIGYKTIIWNIDSLDWKNPGRDAIIDRVMKRLKPGAIILMHASDTPLQTAEALPLLIERLKTDGYKIVTVSELLSSVADNEVLRH